MNMNNDETCRMHGGQGKKKSKGVSASILLCHDIISVFKIFKN